MTADIRPGAGFVDRLRRAGVSVRADEISFERRGDRVMVPLPGGRIAWFATTPDAATALATEDRVLSLVGARCSFRVPVAACASAHRAEAFTACAALVDRIKERVPVWKHQTFADGTTEWVGLGEC